jgi:superfamily II DNA helicase RecQ
MQLRVFTVPLHAGDEHHEELNRFLRSHCVLSVDKRFTDAIGQPCWTFCVEYAEPAKNGDPKPIGKIDYREKLSPEDFAVYDKLRQLRKQMAEAENQPPFVLFTNDQLAQMVKRRVKSLQAMGEIEGIGPARLSKYGDAFLKVLLEVLPE